MTELDTTPAELDGDATPAWVRPTVETAVLWLWRSYNPNTANAYANHLGVPRAQQRWRKPGSRNQGKAGPSPLAFFPWCVAAGLDPHTDMTRENIQTWLTAMDAGGVPKTTQRSRLGAVAAWYREQRYQSRSTFVMADALPRQQRRNAGVSTPEPGQPTVPLTMEQVRALRLAADLDPGRMRLRNRALLAVLTMTGIRAGEACALRRRDVHPTGPGGHPALWIDGKGGKRRWVRLPRTALDAVTDYLTARDQADAGTEIAIRGQVRAARTEALFTTISGRPLETQHVTDALRYLCRSLGRSRANSSTVRRNTAVLRPVADTLHPHQIRHFYAVTAETHGTPTRQIAADLGHASVAVTQTYLDHGKTLDTSAAGTVADLITAGEDLVLIREHEYQPDETESAQ